MQAPWSPGPSDPEASPVWIVCAHCHYGGSWRAHGVERTCQLQQGSGENAVFVHPLALAREQKSALSARPCGLFIRAWENAALLLSAGFTTGRGTTTAPHSCQPLQGSRKMPHPCEPAAASKVGGEYDHGICQHLCLHRESQLSPAPPANAPRVANESLSI